MKILVTGATGTVGRLVVQGLRQHPAEVYALTRSPEKARELPAGVVPVVGDLLDPIALRPAFQGMDALYLLIASTPHEAHDSCAAVALAREAGVPKIVYLSVHQTRNVPEHVPHIAAKLQVERVIRASGVHYTFIQPNFFMQNDLWMKEAMMDHGVYPFPLGDVGASCCDARDIAAASVKVLVEDGHAGKAYTIAGPRAVTGADIAAVWSEALQRPVRYGGHDMAVWERDQVQAGLASWQIYDWSLMFQAWQKGLIATAEELASLEQLVGRPLMTYEAFAKETAAQWAPAGEALRPL